MLLSCAACMHPAALGVCVQDLKEKLEAFAIFFGEELAVPLTPTQIASAVQRFLVSSAPLSTTKGAESSTGQRRSSQTQAASQPVSAQAAQDAGASAPHCSGSEEKKYSLAFAHDCS